MFLKCNKIIYKKFLSFKSIQTVWRKETNRRDKRKRIEHLADQWNEKSKYELISKDEINYMWYQFNVDVNEINLARWRHKMIHETAWCRLKRNSLFISPKKNNNMLNEITKMKLYLIVTNET